MLSRRFEATLAAHGLTPRQLSVLAHLIRNRGLGAGAAARGVSAGPEPAHRMPHATRSGVSICDAAGREFVARLHPDRAAQHDRTTRTLSFGCIQPCISLMPGRYRNGTGSSTIRHTD